METPEFIKKIDWTDLRTQKTSLLKITETSHTYGLEQEDFDNIAGIVHLIDALQDYAVDEMGMNPNNVFDFEQEDEREGYIGIDAPMSETKLTYICPVCNSDNVQSKYWVGLNDMRVDDCDEGEDDFCLDCVSTIQAIQRELPITTYVIGFQIVGVVGSDKEGMIHPDMLTSFCIYNLSWCGERLEYGNDWELLTIWLGDVEEPTMMFTNSMRD